MSDIPTNDVRTIYGFCIFFLIFYVGDASRKRCNHSAYCTGRIHNNHISSHIGVTLGELWVSHMSSYAGPPGGTLAGAMGIIRIGSHIGPPRQTAH